MSYLVLARKWRPQTFSDLVGQEHVSRTLANAIQTNRVAHAFLFTGVRGVGKTTSARIMAKAMNCEKGPTAEPCLVCSACREIAAGADLDVQEIDGASYNGVDEVRRLQEGLPYRPARDRYKIFIVDEVHMLSQSAWNAFLKTLEEPPPHVKFIFATTEVHKVPVTILSRCQRYDFKLIPTQLIVGRLRYVLEQEKIGADEAAIALLAREAAGSLRDAMSLLDQAIAWGGEKLVGEEVSRVLGVAARSVLHDIAKNLIAGDAAACLGILAALSDQGYEMAQVARGILAELRDLVVAKVCKDPDHLLDLADEEAAEVKSLAASSQPDDLVRLHHGLAQDFDDMVRSDQPRAALEMALVRLARRPPLVPLDDLVARLLDLERRLSSGAPAPQGPTRSVPGGQGGPPRTPSRSSAPSAGEDRPHTRTSPGEDRPHTRSSPGEDRPHTRSSPGEDRPHTRSSPGEDRPHTRPSVAPAGAASPTTSTTSPAATGGPLATRVQSGSVAVAAASPAAAAPFRPSALDAWRAVLERVRSDRPALASVLEHASPISFSAERVVLGYEPGSFFAAQATEASAVELLTRHLRAYFGTTTPVAFDLTAGPKAGPSIAVLDGEQNRIRLEQARRAVAEHPLVKAAIEILGAELRDVRLSDS